MAGIGLAQPRRIGEGVPDLLADDLGLVGDLHAVAERLGHLLLAVEPEDLERLGVQRLRLGEDLAEARVEAAADLARQLEVLHLVVADRHAGGAVEQDVGGHQDRIGEQAGVDVLRLALALLLELGHARQLAVAASPSRASTPARSARARATARTAPSGWDRCPQASSSAASVSTRGCISVGVVGLRHRVQIDDAVEAAVAGPAARPSSAPRRGSCRCESRPRAGCPKRPFPCVGHYNE